jgi:hypothetical protein
MILEVIKAPNTPKIAATVPPKIWAKNHSGDEFFDSQYWSTINKARNPNHGIAAPPHNWIGATLNTYRSTYSQRYKHEDHPGNHIMPIIR